MTACPDGIMGLQESTAKELQALKEKQENTAKQVEIIKENRKTHPNR